VTAVDTATRGKYQFTRHPDSYRITVVVTGMGIPLDDFCDDRHLQQVADEWYAAWGEEDQPNTIADTTVAEARTRIDVETGHVFIEEPRTPYQEKAHRVPILEDPEHDAATLVEHLNAQLADATCRHCHTHGRIRAEMRLEARPLGTFSLAGRQTKTSAREQPHAVCGACGHASRGEPATAET
jgi:hypothetical protein